jgi:hypothetical protein
LTDGGRANAERTDEEVQEALVRGGVPVAMKIMAAVSGMDFNDPEAAVRLPQLTGGALSQAAALRMADLALFLNNKKTPGGPSLQGQHRLAPGCCGL